VYVLIISLGTREEAVIGRENDTVVVELGKGDVSINFMDEGVRDYVYVSFRNARKGEIGEILTEKDEKDGVGVAVVCLNKESFKVFYEAVQVMKKEAERMWG
jgi:hypothetical protein